MPPGTPLPAVRSLAGELGVSPTTVSAAFKDLRSRGLVVTRARSGAHVSWRPPVAGAWFGSTAPAGVRDLASGNPDPNLLPDLAPILRRLEPPRQLYGGDPADPQLLELARAEFDQDGIAAEEMAVVSGALDGIERALQARLRPGDVVAVEDPGFAGLYDLLRALGLALRPVSVDGRGMTPLVLADALGEGVDAVVVNPRGQNPTGASLDEERAADPRRRPSRPDRRRAEADAYGRSQPVGGGPLVGQVARARPAARRPRRRRPHDQPRAGAPGRRPRLGKHAPPAHGGHALVGSKSREELGEGDRDLQRAPRTLRSRPRRAWNRGRGPNRPQRLDPRP